MEYLSTTMLARKLSVPREALVAGLLRSNLLQIVDGAWVLTEAGLKAGGKYSVAPDGGRFIQWPSSIEVDLTALRMQTPDENPSTEWLTSTKIAEHFHLDASGVNSMLSEMGWIERDPINGWRATSAGKHLGALDKEYPPQGHYVVWPASLLANKVLRDYVAPEKREAEPDVSLSKPEADHDRITRFRKTLPATFRTEDGHMVRSKAEAMIDNFLYHHRLVHVYERRAPVEEDLYSDFFLPIGNIYIEYWGLEHDPKYLERKRNKVALYERHCLCLVQLTDKHIESLDDHFPYLLLKHGVQVQ